MKEVIYQKLFLKKSTLNAYLVFLDKLYIYNILIGILVLLNNYIKWVSMIFLFYIFWNSFMLLRGAINAEKEEDFYYKITIMNIVGSLLFIIIIIFFDIKVLEFIVLSGISLLGKRELRKINYKKMTGGENDEE